jgi:hypothetical protein
MFNILGRAIATLSGLLMVLMGGVWILQGTGIAFQVGFMAGAPQWAVYGALLALAGLIQVAWSNRRPRAVITGEHVAN